MNKYTYLTYLKNILAIEVEKAFVESVTNKATVSIKPNAGILEIAKLLKTAIDESPSDAGDEMNCLAPEYDIVYSKGEMLVELFQQPFIILTETEHKFLTVNLSHKSS